MNVLSLFDGMSCGQIALKRAGIKVDNYFASEIDKYAIQVTQKNLPGTIQLGDINNWNTWNLPNIDLLIGGFPCQSYSMAGKRLGLLDKRGDLIYRVFDILKYYQPKDFLLENVKGLLSIDKGETFKLILQELNKCGYAVDYLVINSALLSAQNRDRLYVIGKRLDECQEKEYNISYDTAKQTFKKNIHRNIGGIIQERIFL